MFLKNKPYCRSLGLRAPPSDWTSGQVLRVYLCQKCQPVELSDPAKRQAPSTVFWHFLFSLPFDFFLTRTTLWTTLWTTLCQKCQPVELSDPAKRQAPSTVFWHFLFSLPFDFFLTRTSSHGVWVHQHLYTIIIIQGNVRGRMPGIPESISKVRLVRFRKIGVDAVESRRLILPQ